MSPSRVVVTGLDADHLQFVIEIAVQLDTDVDPMWTSVQTWTLPNPYFTGYDRTYFLDRAIAGHGWTVTSRRRAPANGQLIWAVDPADWSRLLTEAAQAAAHYRRVETAWQQLITNSTLPPIEVGQIAAFDQTSASPAA